MADTTSDAPSLASRIRTIFGSGDARAVMARGSVGSIAAQVSGLALVFVTQFALVRMMGVDSFGHYTYVLAWMSTLGLLSALGADTTLLRFVSAYRAKEQWGLLRGVLRWGVRSSLAASMIASAAATLVLVALRGSISSPLQIAFAYGVAVVPALALLQVVGAALRALLNAGRSRLPELVVRPIALLGFASIAYWVSGGMLSGAAAVALHAAALFVAVGAAAFWSVQNLPAASQFVATESIPREWFAVSLPLLLVSSMRVIMAQTDTVLVGLLIDTRSAGIYAITTRLASFTSFVLTASVAIGAPLIAGLYAEKKFEQLQSLLSLAARGIALATIPIVALLALFGTAVLSFFDPEFVEGYRALIILTAGQCVSVLAGMAGSLLSMTGNQNAVARTLTFAALANVVLNILLIPRLQLEGAAIATAVSVVIWNVSLSLIAWRRLGLSTSLLLPVRIHPRTP